MKGYISGKISGLPFEEVIAKFAKAEARLVSMGLEPVNPLKNGLTQEASWNDHMVKDIEMLFGCEAIYLLNDWNDSKGARIEKYIAEQCGITVISEETFAKCPNDPVQQIKSSIEKATGLHFWQYSTSSRKRDLYFARMLYVFHCESHGLSQDEIATSINRDRTTVMHCSKGYDNEMKYNPKFRELSEKVNSLIINNVSH